jgi:hypothetical protein
MTIFEAAMRAYIRAYVAYSCLLLTLRTMHEEF